MTRIFRYVTFSRVPDYLALGWVIVAELPHPHNQWSVLCEWLCQCSMVEPSHG